MPKPKIDIRIEVIDGSTSREDALRLNRCVWAAVKKAGFVPPTVTGPSYDVED